MSRKNNKNSPFKADPKISYYNTPFYPGFYSIGQKNDELFSDDNNQRGPLRYRKKGNKIILIKPWYTKYYGFWGEPLREWYHSPALLSGIFVCIVLLWLQIFPETNFMAEYYPLFTTISLLLIIITLIQRNKSQKYELQIMAINERNQKKSIIYSLISDHIQKCQNCGNLHTEDELFCSFCGYQLKDRI